MLKYKSNVRITLTGRTPNIDYDYFTSTTVEIKATKPIGIDELKSLFESCKAKLDAENIKPNRHMDRFLALMAEARPDWEVTASGGNFTAEMMYDKTSVDYERKAVWHDNRIPVQSP